MSNIHSYVDYKEKMYELFHGVHSQNHKWQKVIEKGYCISRDVRISGVDILIIGINPSYPVKESQIGDTCN